MELNNNHKYERVYIDPLMKFYIEGETRKLADMLKRKHGLLQVNIPLISGSQWLANKLLGNKALVKYKLRKINDTTGELIFL